MARLEAIEGYGVLVLAVALMASLLLRLAVPPPDVLRAAGAPGVAVALPEVRVALHR